MTNVKDALKIRWGRCKKCGDLCNVSRRGFCAECALEAMLEGKRLCS